MERQAMPRRTTLMCGAMNLIGGGLGWAIVPPLLPSIAAELHLSATWTGIVWGAAPLGIALAAPAGGSAVDRFGARRVAGFAMLFGALTCAARAAVVGPWSLALAMFAFGLHIGFVAPAIPKALAGELPARRLAGANGAALLCYTFGTALTVLTARTLIAPALGGWRHAMLFAAAAMALVAVLWLTIVRDRASALRHAAVRDVWRLAANRDLLFIGAMQFLLFGGYLAMLGLLPVALTAGGVPPVKIGLAIAIWLATAGVANFAGPWLSDRIGRRKPIVIGGAIVAGLALVPLALLPTGSALWLLALAALGGGSFAPILLTLPVELPGIGPARAGAALGLLMLIGQIGGFLLPVATGAVAQAHGFGAAIGLLACVHLSIVVPALGLSDPRKAAADAGSTPFPSNPVVA